MMCLPLGSTAEAMAQLGCSGWEELLTHLRQVGAALLPWGEPGESASSRQHGLQAGSCFLETCPFCVEPLWKALPGSHPKPAAQQVFLSPDFTLVSRPRTVLAGSSSIRRHQGLVSRCLLS